MRLLLFLLLSRCLPSEVGATYVESPRRCDVGPRSPIVSDRSAYAFGVGSLAVAAIRQSTTAPCARLRHFRNCSRTPVRWQSPWCSWHRDASRRGRIEDDVAKAYWVSFYSEIHDPDKLAAYAALRAPRSRPQAGVSSRGAIRHMHSRTGSPSAPWLSNSRVSRRRTPLTRVPFTRKLSRHLTAELPTTCGLSKASNSVSRHAPKLWHRGAEARRPPGAPSSRARKFGCFALQPLREIARRALRSELDAALLLSLGMPRTIAAHYRGQRGKRSISGDLVAATNTPIMSCGSGESTATTGGNVFGP